MSIPGWALGPDSVPMNPTFTLSAACTLVASTAATARHTIFALIDSLLLAGIVTNVHSMGSPDGTIPQRKRPVGAAAAPKRCRNRAHSAREEAPRDRAGASFRPARAARLRRAARPAGRPGGMAQDPGA